MATHLVVQIVRSENNLWQNGLKVLFSLSHMASITLWNRFFYPLQPTQPLLLWNLQSIFQIVCTVFLLSFRSKWLRKTCWEIENNLHQQQREMPAALQATQKICQPCRALCGNNSRADQCLFVLCTSLSQTAAGTRVDLRVLGKLLQYRSYFISTLSGISNWHLPLEPR